ncbi:MAG: cardiolipin synthase [Oscillospiraceae bacterium]
MKKKLINMMKFVFSRKSVVVLLLLFQIIMIVMLLITVREHFAFVYGIMTVIGAITVVFIINNNKRSPEYKLAWVIPLLIAPVFAGLAYIYFNTHIETRLIKRLTKEKQKNAEKYLSQDNDVLKQLENCSTASSRLAKYMYRHCNAPIYQNTVTQYFSSGEEKFEMLKSELKKAEHFIFMEYFIIDEGKMWGEILDILIEKAKNGVDVRVIYDGMGSQLILPDKYNKKLCSIGVKCKVFNHFRPFLSSVQNNRDHRKIVVIDGHTAFTGGVNIADEYINHIQKFGHWKDTAIMLKGEAVWTFTMLFLEMWEPEAKNIEDYRQNFAPDVYCHEKFKSDGYIMPYGDSPIDDERAGETVYLDIINNAVDYVYICTPYLILDHELLHALEFAAKSGVDIKIITPGIPDKWYTHAIAQSYYKELISNGIEIYEYSKGFVHAKSFVSDDTTAVVGTINLDYRSLYLHFECAVYMYENSSVKDIKNDFLETLKDCRKIDIDYCNKIPVFKKITTGILRMFSPLL